MVTELAISAALARLLGLMSCLDIGEQKLSEHLVLPLGRNNN